MSLNAREKFLFTLEFDTSVPPPLYEWGYWVQTLERWYKEGMPKVQGIPKSLPQGKGATGPLLGGKKECSDPGQVVNFDKSNHRFPGEFWIFPKFKTQIIEKIKDRVILIDEMGIKKKTTVRGDTIPEYYEWPVKNREDWEKFKNERLNPKTSGRYPENLDQVIEKLKSRDFPLSIGGGQCVGFFGSLRYLVGEVKLFTLFYDAPDLIKDMISYLVSFWIDLWTPILSRIKVDWVNIWEDMCYKNGPLISPEMFREFMLPAYREFTDFLKDHGIKHIIVDTDGNCWELIPLFLEGGVTGLMPMEVAAGMDVVEVRKAFPKLQIIGGIDKRVLAKDKKVINQELESKLPFMLKTGGYIPTIDHFIPPDVPLENFIYYRNRIEEIMNRFYEAR